MKKLTSIAAAALLALAAVAALAAAPNTATVSLSASSVAPGGTIYATFTVAGSTA